ncbi:peptidoglycan DD-metalloendopeptidase family protein [Piscibacillus halophilus]|uniref:Murein DD-endopeptidase MepM and murein hydrolase activator NlpD, contain LysM domain n=1 Tax=Piscibacillus halophilus TaxID=571933 RepID=A0A1H9CYN9_9BACI|nr:M23 family metallopeptidase [Piscibacillus halophilus]SEQ06346.1 Murein DD-endopeptidase MepM and murein hydrolase activator NlpD, contain LysM domain [Piscibacillus halophilus]
MKQLMGRFKDSVKRFRNVSILKMTLLITCLGMGVAFGTVYADSLDESFVEVHHVYVDSEYVGTVKDKEEVESFIETKEEEAESEYDGVDLTPEQKVTYISEVVFTPSDEADLVLDQLEDNLTFNATAIKLQMKDQVIGYVNDLETANKAINNVVNKYLPDELDQEIEFLKMEDDEIVSPILSHLPSGEANQSESDEEDEEEPTLRLEDGSVVLDIGLTENMIVVKEGVDPTKLLTVEQLQKMLERGTKGETVHTIQESEVLSQVASKYDLSYEELLDMNPDLDEDSVVQIGQEVKVEADQPFINVSYTVEKSEEESINYKTVTKNTKTLDKGESKVDQEGKKGVKEITYRVTTKNNEVIKKEKIDEEVIKEPQDEIILKGTREVPSKGTGSLAKPTVGGFITSHMGPRWGSYHKGIDISGVSNRTIKAADNGVVTFAGSDGAYGNKIIIDHKNGLKTVYAHLSSISVSNGQTVKQGQQIGVMGSTGSSTGTHLHFEVIKNGSQVNPTNYVSY